MHYPGGKSYPELPSYLHGWDIALVPFQLNESTRFISPTKTPEYLAGGKPVISTPIRDVVYPYGIEGWYTLQQTQTNWCSRRKKNWRYRRQKEEWLAKSDAFLQDNSWDATWQKMNDIIEEAKRKKQNKTQEL